MQTQSDLLNAALLLLVRLNDEPGPETAAEARAWRALSSVHNATWCQAVELWDLLGDGLAEGLKADPKP